MMIIWIPVINFTAGLNSRLTLPEALGGLEDKIVSLKDSYYYLTTLFLKARSPVDLTVNIFIMAILPALGEELLFRGIFQPLFAGLTRNIHWGIIITALLFSFFHFEFYGFLPRFLLGILFGYLFIWTSSIWIPVLAHFVNNGIIVMYFFFIQPGTGSSKLDELGTRADLYFWLSMGGGILLAALLFYHERSRRLSVS
jgi:membrane protease YdiL (CAAX protease family)